jgi:hypothetical protein
MSRLVSSSCAIVRSAQRTYGVQKVSKFELLFSLYTGKAALGLTVPDKTLVPADEVVE